MQFVQWKCLFLQTKISETRIRSVPKKESRDHFRTLNYPVSKKDCSRIPQGMGEQKQLLSENYMEATHHGNLDSSHNLSSLDPENSSTNNLVCFGIYNRLHHSSCLLRFDCSGHPIKRQSCYTKTETLIKASFSERPILPSWGSMNTAYGTYFSFIVKSPPFTRFSLKTQKSSYAMWVKAGPPFMSPIA